MYICFSNISRFTLTLTPFRLLLRVVELSSFLVCRSPCILVFWFLMSKCDCSVQWVPSITSVPLGPQTSDCNRPSDGRRYDSASTSASLLEVWKSSHTCCVFVRGSCPSEMRRFLYLLLPTNKRKVKKFGIHFYFKLSAMFSDARSTVLLTVWTTIFYMYTAHIHANNWEMIHSRFAQIHYKRHLTF